MKKKSQKAVFIIAVVLLLTITTTASVLALSGSFGGGNSYSTSLSYYSASTTSSFAGGYGGTAKVEATGWFYCPTDPGTVSSSGKKTSSDYVSGGGVTVSVSLSATNPDCTNGYYVSSTHSGTATGLGNTFTYGVTDSKGSQ